MSQKQKCEEEPGVPRSAKGRIASEEGWASAKALRQGGGEPGWTWPLVRLGHVRFSCSAALGVVARMVGVEEEGPPTRVRGKATSAWTRVASREVTLLW